MLRAVAKGSITWKELLTALADEADEEKAWNGHIDTTKIQREVDDNRELKRTL